MKIGGINPNTGNYLTIDGFYTVLQYIFTLSEAQI